MKSKELAVQYVEALKNLLDNLNIDSIEQIIELLESRNNCNGRVFIIGNGGSAVTASHMANDWGAGLKRRDILNIDVISLADNIAVNSALANDVGFENIFLEQIRDNITSKDVIIAISASGNSLNIIKAVNYCKNVGVSVVGCTGFDGGKLKEISDINFHVETQKGEYGLVEDMHMILDHLIYTYFLKRSA